ncbi:LamG-like jellyroll fold domain-containing protein [Catenuloplanes sp. NPDC051500]|uniref:LamG-like jellyroll fold domain-containing protein n=1 Tax=Catenuloplanes sp. NPDC051500 TaxID=3363959 RepID=UPI0037A9FC83
MRVFTAVLAAIVVVAGTPAAASAAPRWEPGTPPIATPWTDEVGPRNALPDYPRPQLTRERWQSLNGVWEFAGAAAGQAPPIGTTLGERVLVPYPIESALSGIQRHEDRMFYRRTFTVPAGWRVGGDQRLRLNFGAVDYDATVWVNGTRVATHRGGYDAFSADVTDALKRHGAQEIVVGVEDLTDATWQPVGKQRTEPDAGIFYVGASGIWQSVWIEPVKQGGVDRLQMTPDITAGVLRLTPQVTNAAGLTVEAVAKQGNRVVGRVSGPAGSELRVPVPDARLWSPESPFLYDLSVRVLRGRTVVDETGSYFGMREIGKTVGADGKLYQTLNGKIVFNLSTLDQGYWPDGIYTAPTDEALRFDIAQTKRLGFNTIRKHIKVEPDRWYYWADRLGLMVWQDMPAMRTGGTPPADAQQEFERQLHEIVDEKKSLTSITTWVPFNEGWGEWDRVATGRIADEVKAQDPTRTVNAHSGVNCCASKGDSGRGDMIDWHDYVGPAAPTPDANRVAADGEHGGFGLEVPGHMWHPDGHAYEMTPDSATLTRRYVENQTDLLRAANSCGLSGSVYTQITDVEHEVNGFYTYDRAVEKMDFDAVAAINRRIIASVKGTGAPAPAPGTPGLTGVGAWPLDEGSGTVTADTAGDHDGTLIGAPAWTTGHDGGALQFSGNGQSVDTAGPVVDTTNSYTAAAWVKLDSLGGWATAVGQDGANRSAFFLQYSSADNRFAFSFAGGRALAPDVPETGRWYHLAGVRDVADGSITLYVDGQRAGTTRACHGDASSGPLTIGRARYNSGPVDFWRGAIDDVRVYDRALSAAEIAELSS